jgi:hypothetical protein
MGWGVLQDPRYPNVPGTVNLNEKVDACMFIPKRGFQMKPVANQDVIAKLEDWEYEEPKKRGDIVLNPQPTDSPNDPLNWLEPLTFIKTTKKLTCQGLWVSKWPFSSFFR